MDNVGQTVISQYKTSPVITGLILAFNDWLDPSANIDEFYDTVFNVDTAQGYGLDVWGRIVGVSRILKVALGKTLGFSEMGSADADPFGQSPFYAGGAVTQNYALSDEAYRMLIYAKALANITDGSIASINQILVFLFPGRGNAYATDGLDMTMTYTFQFPITSTELAVVYQSGVLPRPPGVSVSIVQAG